MIQKNNMLEAFEKLLACAYPISFWQYNEDQTLLYTNSDRTDFFDSLLELDSCKEKVFEYSKNHRLPAQVCNTLNIVWLIEPYHDFTGHFTVYIIGPLFTAAVSADTLRQYMNHSDFSLSLKNTFLKNLKDIPVVSQRSLDRYAIMLHYCLYQEDFAEDLPLITGGSHAISDQNPMFRKTSGHGTYYDELELYGMIECGYVNYKEHLPHLFRGATGELCPGNPLRSLIDAMILFVGGSSMAAIRGGLSEEEAYSWRDCCIQQLEKYSTINEIYQYIGSALDELIRQVHLKKIQTGNYTTDIQRIINYIERNVQERIDWDEMAKSLGYNRTYMCSKFKKETGVSLTEFNNQIKIERAKFLLKNTAMDISAISETLGYTSPSYFTAMFKKMLGESPQNYRESAITV